MQTLPKVWSCYFHVANLNSLQICQKSLDLTRFPGNHCSLTKYYVVKNTEQGSARVFMKTMEMHFSKYNIYMRFLLTYIFVQNHRA